MECCQGGSVAARSGTRVLELDLAAMVPDLQFSSPTYVDPELSGTTI